MHGFLHQIKNKGGASFAGHVVGLLRWAKQKRRTGLFTLSSNCSLANVNILDKRRVQRRTRRSLWIRPGRTGFWWINMIKERCLPSPPAIWKTIHMRHSPQTIGNLRFGNLIESDSPNYIKARHKSENEARLSTRRATKRYRKYLNQNHLNHDMQPKQEIN